MELDDLKGRWQTETNALQQHSPEYIALLLKSKTTDLHSRVRMKYQRILTILLGSMLLLVMVFPVIADGFAYPHSAAGFAKCMALYLVLIIFYWEKFKYVNQLELSDDIQPRLQQLLQYARHSLRLEVGFVLVFFIGIMVLSLVTRHDHAAFTNPSVWAGFSISFVFAAAMLVLIINKHQRVIRELKTYLAEYCPQ
ncbi:hypothetical protein [Chitinophaga parva]|nr:hypothetical protein [Chitinophaga parva]